jgi:hypothetical protein
MYIYEWGRKLYMQLSHRRAEKTKSLPNGGNAKYAIVQDEKLR